MAAPSQTGGEPITGRTQLIEYLEGGCKPREQWRIGTEHEKFAYNRADFSRLAYDGSPGIKVLLEGLTRYGWEPVYEGGNVIALRKPDGASVSLEPGGQFELSGAMLETIHQTCAEVHTHLDEVKTVCEEIGAGMLGLGFDPKSRREDVGWMPKGRYKIMREYMPKKGNHGLDMMLRSCTVQVNLDFDSEADMIKKMRVSLALQPIATALFANSPFVEGKPCGYQSFRSFIWTDTDPDRTGMLPFVFDEGFGFEAHADYVLDVPMYFVYRDGKYIDVSGKSFRDFMAHKLSPVEHITPMMADWEDQLTLPFPEVRLKRFIEMRGADGGPWRNLCALPALWVGLLYDQTALDAAWDLCRDWTNDEREYLRAETPKTALDTVFRKGTVLDVARQVLEIAEQGLKRRERANGIGEDETIFLAELQDVAKKGTTRAQELVAAYEGHWEGDIDKIYGEMSY